VTLPQQPTLATWLQARHSEAFARLCLSLPASSLALYGGGDHREPHITRYPSTLEELATCEATWELAPDEVRARMLPVLVKYRAHVASLSTPLVKERQL
jgi:hypothetical protein